MAEKDPPNFKLVADNRRARFDYELGETFEAGIMLTGTEVKSLRNGKATIAESYAAVDRNAAALRVMQAAGVPVDDLCAFVAPQRAKLGLLKDVHYTSAGYAALAGEVVKALEPLLAK